MLVTFIICLGMPLPLLPAPEVKAATMRSQVIFTEDFEGERPGTYPNECCAAIATRRATSALVPDHVLLRLGDPRYPGYDPYVTCSPTGCTPYYDTNMSSFMRRQVLGVEGYSSIGMAFKHWSRTGSSTTALGEDRMLISTTANGTYNPPTSEFAEV